jgi:hypothetical protein
MGWISMWPWTTCTHTLATSLACLWQRHNGHYVCMFGLEMFWCIEWLTVARIPGRILCKKQPKGMYIDSGNMVFIHFGALIEVLDHLENDRGGWLAWNYFIAILSCGTCRNPTLAKCEDETHHVSQPHFGLSVRVKPTLPKMGSWSPPGLPKTQSSISGVKSPCIWAFLRSLKISWSVDVQNGLALVIWTSAAQVMGKRRAGSQTGSLTPDH